MPSSNSARAVRVLALVGLAAGALAGCRGAKPAPPAPPPPMVTVARPVTANVQSYHDYNGYLDAVEAVEIRARVKGFLTDVRFVEGNEVKVRDPLYTIDPREYQAGVAKAKADSKKAEADISNAKAQITLAEAEEARQRDAYTKGAGSKTDFDRAVATLAANRATLDSAVANLAAADAAKQTADLQLEFTDIRSPIAGRINRTLVTKGNLVGQSESTLLTTIVSVDPLYVYFDAPERDFVETQRALKSGPRPGAPGPALPIKVGIATDVGYPHVGSIDFQENRADTGTGTVRIRGRVPNPLTPGGHSRLLYPGLYARVRVPVGQEEPRLVIPEEALMTGQEGRFVYVVGKDGMVQKRTVVIGSNVWRAPDNGPVDPTRWSLHSSKPPAAGAPVAPPAAVRSVIAIEKGLEAGDLVVVNGLQKARPGAPVTPDTWEFRPPVAAAP